MGAVDREGSFLIRLDFEDYREGRVVLDFEELNRRACRKEELARDSQDR